MISLLPAIKSLFLLIGGYFFIFTGIAFSNTKLFPELLGGIYDQTSFLGRILIFSIVFGLPGNYLISKSFQVTSASVTGPLLLMTVLVITIVNAMILDKVHLTFPIIGAIAGAMFFCCLTAWLLEGQRLAQ